MVARYSILQKFIIQYYIQIIENIYEREDPETKKKKIPRTLASPNQLHHYLPEKKMITITDEECRVEKCLPQIHS